MNKKDILSLTGLLATTSLAVVSGGLVGPAVSGLLSGVGNIGSGLAANFIMGLTPDKIKRLFVDVHPNDLNHSVKRLFVASIKEALSNIAVLFSETDTSEKEKKHVKQLIKTLQKEVPDVFLKTDQIKFEESEIKRFLYEKDKEEMICRYIAEHFNNFGISDPFKTFLAQNLPAQIQLCFGEGLKDPANEHAWIAFQRMLIEEIRNDIKQIADTQQSIRDDLSDLKFEKSGFSKQQIDEVQKLVKILNDKKLVEVKIKSEVNHSLKSIENRANEIIKITTKTQLTVNELKMLIEKIKRQNRINHLIISILSACLLAAGVFVAYKLINQPFTATIKVYGWENAQHYPLDGKGCLVLTLGDKTEKAEINRQGEAVFKGIPPKFNNTSVSAYITDTEGEPYYLPDSIIKIQKNNTTKVQILLRGLEKLEGTVFDIAGEGLPDVSVTIADITVATDANGKFKIAIPIAKQRFEQEVEICKDGYKSKRQTIPMTGEHKYKTILERK